MSLLSAKRLQIPKMVFSPFKMSYFEGSSPVSPAERKPILPNTPGLLSFKTKIGFPAISRQTISTKFFISEKTKMDLKRNQIDSFGDQHMTADFESSKRTNLHARKHILPFSKELLKKISKKPERAPRHPLIGPT
jgi:hypothetical protein